MAGLSFTQQIKSEMGTLKSKISEAVTASAISAWKVAVFHTPVLTGNLRNSWRLSRDRRSSYVPRPGNKGYPAAPSFRYRATKDSRVYLYNNVPYASFVENGNGPGSRVPRMMLRRAEIHFAAELNRRLGQ